jgi:ferritin-like metal-binding protein YciE
MKGLVEEGSEIIQEDGEDAALIAAAQKVEHYEIAGYGSARTFAQLLGEEEAVRLLEETLQEESNADEKLTQAAQAINEEADDEDEEGDEEDEEDEDEEEMEEEETAGGSRRGR